MCAEIFFAQIFGEPPIYCIYFAGVDRTEGRKRQGEKEGAADFQGQRLRQSQHQAASGRRRQGGISHQAQKRR